MLNRKCYRASKRAPPPTNGIARLAAANAPSTDGTAGRVLFMEEYYEKYVEHT